MRKLFILALALVFLFVTPAVRASSAPVSRKAYTKEVTKILAQFKKEVGEYQHQPPAGVDAESASIYVTLLETDIKAVNTQLTLFKKHKATQDDVDTALRTMSRDAENQPPVGESSAVDPLSKA